MLVWHRKARKTTTAIYELVKQAHLRKGLYWHLFPTFTEGKDTIWRDPNMIFHFIPEQLIAKKNDSECVIYFKNGSLYQLQGSDDVDRLRGPGPYGVVLDEFATMKFEAWQVIEPAVIANNAWAWFIGTPKGKNHLFEFMQRGGKLPGWASWHLTGEQSGIYNPFQLNQLKTSMTQKMYEQEVMCNFLENEGTVFRSVRGAMISHPSGEQPKHLYVIGCDLAKVTDYTVLTVYDRMKNNQVYQDRFQTIEWPFQKQRIAALSRKYNDAIVVIDATGIGDPIADDLIRINIPVIPVKITEQVKKELIEKLSIWIEQRKCLMLPLHETLEEFENFSYEIGVTGKIRYQARTGYHDDIVLSHALAVSQLTEIVKNQQLPNEPRIRNYYNSIKDQYNRSIIDTNAEWDSEY